MMKLRCLRRDDVRGETETKVTGVNGGASVVAGIEITGLERDHLVFLTHQEACIAWR